MARRAYPGHRSGFAPSRRIRRTLRRLERAFAVEALEPRRFFSVTLTNGLPEADPSYYVAIISNGGSSSDVRLAGIDTVYAYRAYLEVGGAVHNLSSLGTAPVLDGDAAVSTATISPAGGGTINVEIESRLPAGSTTLVTRYALSASGGASLQGAKLFQYLDTDVPPSAGDDVLKVMGSIADGDLELITIDPVTYVQEAQTLGLGLLNATVSGFAADRYSDLSSAITAGNFNPGLDGFIDTGSLPLGNFTGIGAAYGPSDVGTAIVYTINHATTAIVRTAVGSSDIAVDLADLRVTQVLSNAAVIAGQSLPVSWTVFNDSNTAAAGTWTDSVYLSTDAQYDGGDVLLGTRTHSGGLAANSIYQAAQSFSTSGVNAGNYYVIVRTDSGSAVPEGRLENNNNTASEATAQVGIGQLVVGQPSNANVPQGQNRYFAVTVPAGTEHLLLELNDADNLGVTELYARYGTPPTTVDFTARAAEPGMADQTLSLLNPNPGTWYVMVRSAQGNNDISLTASTPQLELLSVSPGQIAQTGPIVLQLEGLGFDRSTQVRVLDALGNPFTPDAIDIWSQQSMSVTFDAGLPVGNYDVAVSEPDFEGFQLDDALTVVATGQEDFRVNLITPAYQGYHELATIVLEYSNEGDTAMRAPLVFVTAEQADRRAALLTLDRSRLTYGFWTAAKPEGFENYVQVLASGEIPGWLLPGETGRVEIYYAGWQQPWNFSYPPFEWTAAAIPADATAPINWDNLADDIRPQGLADDAWTAVRANLLAGVGDTWGDYVTMLGENAAHMAQLGDATVNARELFALEYFQANAGNPIQALGGAVDVTLPAPGIDLAFSRLYPQTLTSRYRSGALGRGWMHSWETSLSVRDDGSIDINAPDDHRLFQPDSRGGYLAEPGDAARLTALPANAGYTLREGDGRIMTFNAAGQLISAADANGNTVTLTYTAGKLTSLAHDAGPTLTLTYNQHGTLASIADHLGRTSTFTYDNTGQYLLSVTHFDDTVTSYTYHTTGSAQQRHALESITLPDGSTTFYAYDSMGRLTQISDEQDVNSLCFTYGPAATITADSGDGDTVTYLMTPQGQVGASIDALGRSFGLAIDERLRITGATDPGGATARIEYDAAGNPARMIDALGNVTRLTFNPATGGLASMTDALHHTNWYSYDNAGNLLHFTDAAGAIESFSYDDRGLLEQSINRRGQTTTYTTNNLGLVTARNAPDTADASYVYDAFGRLSSMTDASGTTTFTYTDSDLIERVTYPGGEYLEYEYNDAGQRTRQTDQAGHIINYHYDPMGQLLELTDGSAQRIVTYVYDNQGRIITRTLGNGSFTLHQYNDAGQITLVANFANNMTPTSRFEYLYDEHGALTTMITSEGDWHYTYDALGQVISAIFTSDDENVAPSQTLSYSYDAVGNRVQCEVNGTEENYTANVTNGYLTAGDATFTYDADGNMTSRTDDSGTWTYSYDSLNRLTGVTHGGDTWSYTYNGLGQRVASTFNGITTRYVIDPAGMGNVVGAYAANGSLIARYDWGLDLASTTAGGATSYYHFDGIGNTTELLGAGGAIRNTYRYLPFGQTLIRSEQVANDFEFMGGAGVIQDGTGLSFMRARSYDPALGRFIQQDPIGVSGGSINFYTYGENSPLIVTDPAGLQSTYHKMIYMALLKKFPHAKTQLMNIMRAVPNTGNFEAFAAMNGVDIAALRQLYLTKFAGAGARFVGTTAAATTTTAATSAAATTTTTAAAGAGAGAAGAGAAAGTGGFLAWPGAMAAAAAAATAVLVWQGGSYLASGVGSLTGSDTLSDVGAAMDAALSPDGWQTAYDYYRDWLFGSPSQTVGSFDPNQKIGPAGYGDAHYVAPGSLAPYRIDFENDSSATAPAKIVRVNDNLDSDLDWSTFEISQVGWGDIIIPVDPGTQHFETTQSVTINDVTFDVHVEIEFNQATGAIAAIFESLDPVTGLPMGAANGFLPPEDGTGRGQGFFSYLVRTNDDLATGTEIRNVATIIFDFNEAITTNQVDVHDPGAGTDPNKEALITIDAATPSSEVTDLPATVLTPTFTVSWSGSDVGAGVAGYDVYVKIDNGNWTPWLLNTSATSADYSGAVNHTYAFYSVATDGVGHREAAPGQADTTVAVSDEPPYTEKDFGGKTVATWTDTFGRTVSVSLKGAGSGVVRVPIDGTTPATVILTGTDATSALTFKNSSPTTIAGIESDGPLKSVTGKLVDLAGDGDFAGAVAKLTLRNLVGPGTLTLGGSNATAPVTLALGAVSEFDLISGAPIKSIKALSWTDDDDDTDTLTAPWITGATISGDFEADLSLTEHNTPTSLGKLSVIGWLHQSTIRSASNLGTISVGGMNGAHLWLDMQPGTNSLPQNATPFLLHGTSLKSLSVKGTVSSGGLSYLDSVIAGWSLGKLSLNKVSDSNGGEMMGVSAAMIGQIAFTHDGTAYKGRALASPDDTLTLTDFEVRLVETDF